MAIRSRPKNEFQFSGKLVELKGTFSYAAVLVPKTLLSQMPEGRLRVKGQLNHVPIDLAIQYRVSGPRFIMVSKLLARKAHVKIGDAVTVSFKLTNPKKVEIPEELAAVLAQDEESLAAWKKLTPGLQRSLCYYVNSVKNVDSRIKRSFEMVNKIKTGQLYLQRKKAEN
jgi:hypothetical protein